MNEQELIDKLLRIQALHAGASTQGERAAAEKAMERVATRLRQERYARASEYKFTLSSSFQVRLFVALVRRHGLEPYRRKRQRRTTVMVRVSPRYVDEVLWPEFVSLSDTLREYLDEVTDRVIAQAVHGDRSDASVVAGELGSAGAR